MKPLTPRQAEVLELIKANMNETGMPPTRAEIAQKLGFKSANAAEEHLKALAKKGVIEIMPGTWASRVLSLRPASSRATVAPEAVTTSLPAGTLLP